MGLFKSLKDMKETVAAVPDMVDQANQLQANAQAMAAAQQATAAQAMAQAQSASAAAVAPATGPDFEPVDGVGLQLYAEISKGLAAYNYDQSKGPEIAASKGVSADAWAAAVTEWNARMQRNPAVGKAFNTYYTSAV